MRKPSLGGTSLSRLIILSVLLLVGGVTLITPSRADTAAQRPPPAAPANAAAEPREPRGQSVFSIVMDNVDAVFITIGVLSVAGLTFIIQGFLQNRRSVVTPPETISQLRDLIAQKKFKELVDFTNADDTFVSRSLNAALKRAPDFEAMREAMETTVSEQTAERFRKIEYLNVIGNLGPLLGLLGTVWGMIIAFSEMNAAGGNASPAQLADGVSKVLAHTFLGLMLAVPCLAAFGILRTTIDRVTVEASLLAEELLLLIKPTDARGGAGVGSGLSNVARPGSSTPQPIGPSRKGTPADA